MEDKIQQTLTEQAKKTLENVFCVRCDQSIWECKCDPKDVDDFVKGMMMTCKVVYDNGGGGHA